jgi:hypothetical protein
MKVAVIGGTGLIGSQVVAILNAGGHEAVRHSASTGLDLLTGKGLRGRLVTPHHGGVGQNRGTMRSSGRGRGASTPRIGGVVAQASVRAMRSSVILPAASPSARRRQR